MNKTKIIKQMTSVVKDVMTRNQSDFFAYDTKAIERLTDEQLPVIWACGKLSTYMFYPLQQLEYFHPGDSIYWDFLKYRTLPYQYLAEGVTLENHHFFLILPKGIQRLECTQIKNVMLDIFAPAIEKLKAENGGIIPSFETAWEKYRYQLAKNQ